MDPDPSFLKQPDYLRIIRTLDVELTGRARLVSSVSSRKECRSTRFLCLH